MAERYARMVGDVVAEVFEFEPGLHASLEVVAVPPEVEPNWRRVGARFRAPAPVVVTVPVPAAVSSAQAKIALKRAGYLPAVAHAIDALGDDEAAIWFTDARVWERAHPRVLAVAGALGMSSDIVDDLFRAAAAIAA